jgi:hypothetical protein
VQRPNFVAARQTPIGVIGERETLVVIEFRNDRVYSWIESFDLP